MTQSLHWEGFSFSLLLLLVCQLAQPSRGCAEMLAPCWGSSAQCQAAHSAWLFGDPPCTPRSSPGMPHHTTPSFPATLNVVPVFVFFLYFECLAHLSGKVCCNFTVGNVVAQCGCLSNVLFAEIISPGYIDLSVNQLLHENKKGKKCKTEGKKEPGDFSGAEFSTE